MSYIQAEGIEPLKEVINIIINDKQKKSANSNKDAQTLTSQVAKEFAKDDSVRSYNQDAKKILTELELEKSSEERRI